MKLRRYLDLHIISQSEFARAMDVTPAAVCRWLQDLRIPRHDHLRKIKKLTGGKVRPKDFTGPVFYLEQRSEYDNG